MGVEQAEQFPDGEGVVQVVGCPGGQWPGPARAVVADSESFGGVGEGGPGVIQGVLRLSPGGGGEAFDHADQRLVLGILAVAAVIKSRQYGLGGGGVAA